MPYVEQARRPWYDGHVSNVSDALRAEDYPAGDVNYVLSRILYRWWEHKPRYITICLVVGTLVCVALEFYWKVARKYEDKECEDNGEVFM